MWTIINLASFDDSAISEILVSNGVFDSLLKIFWDPSESVKVQMHVVWALANLLEEDDKSSWILKVTNGDFCFLLLNLYYWLDDLKESLMDVIQMLSVLTSNNNYLSFDKLEFLNEMSE